MEARSRRRLVVLLLCTSLWWVSGAHSADTATPNVYPWSAEASEMAGRLLAIRHVLGMAPAHHTPGAQPYGGAAVEMAPDTGPVGMAFAGASSPPQPRRSPRPGLPLPMPHQRPQTSPTLANIQSQMQRHQWHMAQQQMRLQAQQHQWQTAHMRFRLQTQRQRHQWQAAQHLARPQQAYHDLLLRQQTSHNVQATLRALHAQRGQVRTQALTRFTTDAAKNYGQAFGSAGFAVIGLADLLPAAKPVTTPILTARNVYDLSQPAKRHLAAVGLGVTAYTHLDQPRTHYAVTATVEIRPSQVHVPQYRGGQRSYGPVPVVEVTDLTVTRVTSTSLAARLAQRVNTGLNLWGVGSDLKDALHSAGKVRQNWHDFTQTLRHDVSVTRAYRIDFRTPYANTSGMQTMTQSALQRTIRTQTMTRYGRW